MAKSIAIIEIIRNKVALQYAPHDPLKDVIEDYLDKVWTKDEICIPQILIGLKKESQRQKQIQLF